MSIPRWSTAAWTSAPINPMLAERAAVLPDRSSTTRCGPLLSATRGCHDADAHWSTEINRRGRLALLVGGTMMYFKAAAARRGCDAGGRSGGPSRCWSAEETEGGGWPALPAGAVPHRRRARSSLAPAGSQRIQRAGDAAQSPGRPISNPADRPQRCAPAAAGGTAGSLDRWIALAACPHRAALRRHAGRRAARRGACCVARLRPACRAAGDALCRVPARPGSAGRHRRRGHWVEAASPQRASSPNAGSPGCAAAERTVIDVRPDAVRRTALAAFERMLAP